jgi:Carbohydrate esterase, sialic acid-specific acetylesterase
MTPIVSRRDFLHAAASAGAVASCVAGSGGVVAEDTTVAQGKLALPLPYSVAQREGYDPLHASVHEPGGAKLGFADVAVAGEFSNAKCDAWQIRAVPLKDAFGSGIDWTKLDAKLQDGNLSAVARIPAGGWYRLEVRGLSGEKPVVSAGVEPVGVGEVLVIAGQSYAAGANDELLKVEDAAGRVVAFDPAKNSWRVAHDPQPNVGDGGTIWPELGNLLLPIVQLPVGFVNVAVGGTASRQWLPGEALYENLSKVGSTVGQFRAVLWQQGESDVIEGVSTEKHVANITAIRTSLAGTWKFAPPWLLAKSTLHPTVYNKPAEEARIRTAIDQLVKQPGFRPGPDTDILAGENRGGPKTRRHFSSIGQRRAALLWFAAVWQELQRTGE